MAGAWTTLAILDGGGTSRNMRVWDESGAGTGPFTFAQLGSTETGTGGILAQDSSLSTINTTLGTPMQASGGSVTANAGTNLNTSSLATSANQTNATQKTQIVDGSGNVIASTANALNVSASFSAVVSTTSTQTNPSYTSFNAASYTMLAASALTYGVTIYNNTNAVLYVLLAGAGTASATLFTLIIQPQGYYEAPFNFKGAIYGFQASGAASSGNVNVTQFTA